MLEVIRLVFQAIAAGIGWLCLSTYAAIPVIWYLRRNPDIDPHTIVMWSTLAWAGGLGLLYEAIEIRWRRWVPYPRPHIGGLLYALGGGMTFYNAMPMMIQMVWHYGGQINRWTLIWLMVGMIAHIAGCLFWTFQSEPEEDTEEVKEPVE